MPLSNWCKHADVRASVTRITYDGADFLCRTMGAVRFSLTLFSTGWYSLVGSGAA
jgi:hypothetical protein